jgi:hypothetical protein
VYEPIRIQFDVSDLLHQLDTALGYVYGTTNEDTTTNTIDSIAATKLYLLIYEILPMTTMSWADIVRVVPIVGGIYPLDAKKGGSGGGGGAENDNFIPTTTDTTTTTTTTAASTDDPIHAMYCPDETTSGIAGGGSGADLLIYATVNRHCDGAGFEDSNSNNMGGNIGTLATALSCQRDQYDRPITGSIDFCLDGMDSSTESFVILNDIQSRMVDVSKGRYKKKEML